MTARKIFGGIALIMLITSIVLIIYRIINPGYVAQYISHKKEPSFTIYGWHEESIGTLDFFIYNGFVRVPADLRQFLGDTL